MADYTVIVDDNNGQIIYGPSEESWSVIASNDTFQGTLHQAVSQGANMTLPFVGGREVVIVGTFVGDNDTITTTYPVFEVDSQYFLDCNPTRPQIGDQFRCNSSLPSVITNRTLITFANPRAQQFHIDYIRHGSSSHSAATANRTIVYVKAPDDTTPGLSFEDSWQYRSIGGTNDIKKAMHVSTTLSTATYYFSGNSFTWWGCCLPVGTSSNAASVTYSIDGGDPIFVQVDENFIQGSQCKDEKILFQILGDQISLGSHILEVSYGGDDTKMPLTLCGLAAAPSNLDFSALDVHPGGSSASSATPAPTQSSTTSSSGSTRPKGHSLASNTPSPSAMGASGSSRSTGVIVGVIAAIVFAFLCVSIIIFIWRKRKRTMRQRQERRSSTTDSLSSFAFHPFVGFLDTEKQTPMLLEPPPAPVMVSTGVSTMPLVTDEQDGNGGLQRTDTRSGSSQLESRPPSYRTAGSLLSV